MDARITKQRLANLLSYDWLKIIVAIVFATLGLVVFFTTVKTRPRKTQRFSIYGYRELVEGGSSSEVTDQVKKGVLSYDILDVELENFGTGQYSETAFMARRSTELGTVMFTTTNLAETEEGEEPVTVLQALTGGRVTELTLDLKLYMSDCENYLIRFFGENWQEGALNEAEAEKCFLARNGKDRRFRSDEKKQAGIALEQERLLALREDFIAVSGYLADGTVGYSYVTDDKGEQRAAGFSLGGLSQLRKLFYYTVKDANGASVQSTQNICLVLFRNDEDAGKRADLVENDLRYEPISFLRYVVEKFG